MEKGGGGKKEGEEPLGVGGKRKRGFSSTTSYSRGEVSVPPQNFREACARAAGAEPRVVITDKLASYAS